MCLLLNHPSANPVEMMRSVDCNGRNIIYEAACRGHSASMSLCLAHPSFSAELLSDTDANRFAIGCAARGGHAAAVRLLLDHQALSGEAVGAVLIDAARAGRVEVMRVVLDHPSDPAEQMVATDVFTVAAEFAVQGDVFMAEAGVPEAEQPTPSFAPLLLLLRHQHERTRPSDAETTATAMDYAIEALSPLLQDKAACAARDESVRLLLELGATWYDPCSPVTSRVIRERLQAGLLGSMRTRRPAAASPTADTQTHRQTQTYKHTHKHARTHRRR
jgi:hypothetical protein